jgi:ribonuclease Z
MKFSVTILGSNSAIPAPGRNPSAQVVNVHERLFLVDCAEGTQVQIRRFKIHALRINHVFISHLHGDHFFGLIGLVSTYNLHERHTPLHIYAPQPLEKVLQIQLEVSGTQLAFPFHFHPIDPSLHQVIFEDDELTVEAFPVNHRIPTCGFLFREKIRPRNVRKDFLNIESPTFDDIRNIKAGGDFTNPSGKHYSNEDMTRSPYNPRMYAYCTDTSYYEPIIGTIRDADLLYHEATFMEKETGMAEVKYHATSIQAATIAVKAAAKRLLLGHFSNRYDDLQPLLDEARRVFPETYLAMDGDVFDIPLQKRQRGV